MDLERWEYMWMVVNIRKGRLVFTANGQELASSTYTQALNALGWEGWELVSVISPPFKLPVGFSDQLPTFCLKRKFFVK